MTGQLRVHWRINERKDDIDVRTVDLIISNVNTKPAPIDGFITERFLTDRVYALFRGANAQKFKKLLQKAMSDSQKLLVKILVPARDGYVLSADMVDYRFFGCERVLLTSTLPSPRQHVKPFAFDHMSNDWVLLHDVCNSAIGSILVEMPPDGDVVKALNDVDDEVVNRLSLNWILPDPIPYKRLAIVGYLPEVESFERLKAIGIGLVMLAEEGHPFADPNGPEAHLREEFVVLDTNPNAGLPKRIVEAVRDLHIDGILTRYDVYQKPVAEACEILGLPTSPPSGFAIATDKHAARMLESDNNQAVRIVDVKDLQHQLKAAVPPLVVDYPVVVKPCTGRMSWSVVKASNEPELFAAVEKAYSRVIGSENGKTIHSEIMIEPYINGPEIDINFGMWKGEAVFWDVADNFPTAGDLSDEPGKKDFQETQFLYPSILPQEEQKLVMESLRQSLLRIGFDTGCFHVEARVRNSSMHYAPGEDGRLDLVPYPRKSVAPPSSFMIEINPRPLGYMGHYAMSWTFGVDYHGMHAFRALGDEHRFRAFARPFKNGPQHTGALVLIMPEKGGILKSADPGDVLRAKRPDLMEYITKYRMIFKQGEYVTPPDAADNSFVSTMIVKGRKGRSDLLRAIEEIRAGWHVEIE